MCHEWKQSMTLYLLFQIKLTLIIHVSCSIPNATYQNIRCPSKVPHFGAPESPLSLLQSQEALLLPSNKHSISPIISMFTSHTLVGAFITDCFDCVTGFLSCVPFSCLSISNSASDALINFSFLERCFPCFALS